MKIVYNFGGGFSVILTCLIPYGSGLAVDIVDVNRKAQSVTEVNDGAQSATWLRELKPAETRRDTGGGNTGHGRRTIYAADGDADTPTTPSSAHLPGHLLAEQASRRCR